MLDTTLDPLRIRQYFNGVTMTRKLLGGIAADVGFLDTLRHASLPMPWEHRGATELHPFPPMERRRPHPDLGRVAVVASGGSGVLASLVGVARALEESGVRPEVYSLCSGAALFGFPLAAGKTADEVAEFVLGQPAGSLVDVDWSAVLGILPRLGRGFTGILRGDRVEAVYREWLGDIILAEMPIPAYAPVWNVERNTCEYIGPSTRPEMTVAHAVRMAVALPLFARAVELDGDHYYDGGTVDILPVRPVLDLEEPPDTAIALNCFYPPGFAGDDMRGWTERRWSILEGAWQVRSCQHLQLGRDNLDRLRREVTEVMMLDPVPYRYVRGVGLYREFSDNRNWPEFMRMGRRAMLRALHTRRAAVAHRSRRGAA